MAPASSRRWPARTAVGGAFGALVLLLAFLGRADAQQQQNPGGALAYFFNKAESKKSPVANDAAGFVMGGGAGALLGPAMMGGSTNKQNNPALALLAGAGVGGGGGGGGGGGAGQTILADALRRLPAAISKAKQEQAQQPPAPRRQPPPRRNRPSRAQRTAPALVVAKPADILCSQLLGARNFTRLIMDAFADAGAGAFPERTTPVDGTESFPPGAANEPGPRGLRRIFNVMNNGGAPVQDPRLPPPPVPNREVMRRVIVERRRTLCTVLNESPELGRIGVQALNHGVQLRPYGLDMSVLLDGLRRALPNAAVGALSADLRVQATRALYLGATDWDAAEAMPQSGPCTAGMLHTAEFNRRFFEEDMPARVPSREQVHSALCGDERAAQVYALLRRDGFVKIDQFKGVSDEAMAEIEALAMDALNTQVERDGDRRIWHAAPQTLDAPLRALFGDESLNRALGAYLAPHLDTPLRLEDDFYWSAYRVGAHLTSEQQALDSFYHHDGAGRQLKLYLYLHDVPEFFGRATRIVKGTHNTNYYSSACDVDTRLSDTWVKQKFPSARIARMSGLRGGGFIFDPNGLHRLAWEDPVQRDAIVIQIIAPGKCKRIKQPDVSAYEEENSPCPQRPFRPFAREYDAADGSRATGWRLLEGAANNCSNVSTTEASASAATAHPSTTQPTP